MSPWIGVSQASKLLGRSPSTIRRWIASGKLSAYKDGNRWRVAWWNLLLPEYLKPSMHPKQLRSFFAKFSSKIVDKRVIRELNRGGLCPVCCWPLPEEFHSLWDSNKGCECCGSRIDPELSLDRQVKLVEQILERKIEVICDTLLLWRQLYQRFGFMLSGPDEEGSSERVGLDTSNLYQLGDVKDHQFESVDLRDMGWSWS